MIDCKPYGSKFMTADTCVARQKKIEEILPKVIGKEEKGEYPFFEAYQQIAKCRDCETGLKLYQEFKKGAKTMGKKKVRICDDCGLTFPASHKYFDVANRAHDNCTKDCKWCRQGLKLPGNVFKEIEHLNLDKVEQSTPVESEQPKVEEPVIKKEAVPREQTKFIIDFTGDTKLLDSFKKYAKKKRRLWKDQVKLELEKLMKRIA